MINWSNVGLFFERSKAQMEEITSKFEERENKDDYILQKGRAKYFTPKAMSELIQNESLNNDSTQIITVANQKGGVGKTSTVLTQARNLKDLGFKVLIVEADPQSNITLTLLKKETSPTLYNVLNGDCSVKEAIVNVRENLDLLPANTQSTANIDFILSQPEFAYNPTELLSNLLLPLDYDYVLIDTNPSLNSINIACIASSHRVICPVPLSDWEVAGIRNLSKVVNGIRTRLKSNVELHFLVNKFSKSETTAYDEIAEIKKIPGHLFNTLIPNASAFNKAQKSGTIEISGRAYKETLRLTKEILENNKSANPDSIRQ